MKKIAIITTSEGGGHNAAAYALSEVIKHKFPQNEVKVFDIHDYLDKTTRVGLISSYLAIVEHLPILWKYIYHTSNGVSGNKAFTKGIELIARFSAKKLIEAITLFKPTDIIATHFFAPYFIQGTPWEKIPMSVVVTDYGWHAAWYHPLFSHYFVATPEIKKEIIHTFSINSNAITVSGIPVSPRFFESKDQKTLRKQYKMPAEKPLVLILTGGFGLIDPSDYIKKIWKQDISIIVITGKNAGLKKKITDLAWPSTTPHAVIGWTTDVADYMQAADIVITKPGGLSTTECVTLGKPMILITPIPGQEEHNSNYLVKTGAALFAESPAVISSLVSQILHKPNRAPIKKQSPAEMIVSHLFS